MNRELRVIEYTKSIDKVKKSCSDLLEKGYQVIDGGSFSDFNGKMWTAVILERKLLDIIKRILRRIKCLNLFCRI